jgi:hypothetical protein
MEEFEKPATDRNKLSAEYSRAFEHGKWVQEIPIIDFGPNLLVRPIPPFAGAVVRFLVYDKHLPGQKISVYLDCYDMLGFYQAPYWEAYPINGDTFRVAMPDVNELMCAIEEEFARRRNGYMAGIVASVE